MKDNFSAREVFRDNMNHYMEMRGVDQSQIVEDLGVTASTVSDWVLGKKYPRIDKMQKLADYFGISLTELTGPRATEPSFDPFQFDNILPVQPHRIPLLGSVAAGQPIYEPEDFDVTIPVGSAVHCDYALRVKGDSMKPTYLDGDIVLIHQQPTFDDGRIAVVAIGEEATLKHVYRTRNGITLVSDNPDYPPMPFVEDECDEIRIMGKPVAYLRGV